MGLLDTILSTIDNKKRTFKRGVMDMLDNPKDWSEMTAARMNENMYGGPENWDAMKKYYQRQPYDKKLRDKALQSMTDNMINESLGAVTAWHGSPHKFDKFDMSKIGTGEGAQAYGHGLYLAETPEVAKSYADDLTKMRVQAAQSQLNKYGGNVDDAIDASRKEIDRLKSLNLTPATGAAKRDSLIAGQEEKLAELMAYKNQGSMNQGQLYKVDIPDEAVAKFLDWDKPLSEQAPEVQVAISKMRDKFPLSKDGWDIKPWMDADPLASTWHNEAVRELGVGQDFFTKNLSENGVPGIRYLDGGSRSAGQGSSNYVLFDDQLPRILERNGQPTGLQPWAKGEWKGLLDEPAPKLTEFEQRHLTAQKNAALPVEQGGLGLPPNNTAMDRARAMGFDTDVYHGTGADVSEFAAGNKSSHTAGSAPSTMHWLSGEPSIANGYALSAYYTGNPNVMPLIINKGKEFSRDMKGKGPMSLPGYSTDAYAGKKLKTNDTVTLENFKDAAVPGYGGGMGTHIAVKDPANIRSRFAAFDPMRRHEADLLGYADPYLLGAMGAGGLLGLGGYSMMNDK